jgi:succinate-acetate transporter protein
VAVVSDNNAYEGTYELAGQQGRSTGSSRDVPAVERTRIMLRPIAGSAPLAFYTFGVGTILYTSSQLKWIDVSESHSLALLLVTFVAPLQLLAGLLGFLARDAGLATVMVIFGGVWFGLGAVTLASPPGSRSVLLGIFLLMISAVIATAGCVAIVARPMVFALAVLAVARYALSGAYEITGNAGTQRAAGWLGIPIVALSLYGGTAFLLEEMTRRTVLPIGRRRDAAAAMRGGLDDQVAHVSREAGVRQRL